MPTTAGYDTTQAVGAAGDAPVLVAPQALLEMVRGTLAGMGCAEVEQREVADHLVESNLQGHDSHGVQMLPVYAAGIRSGRMRGNVPISVVPAASSFLVVDGYVTDKSSGKTSHAFGQHAMSQAVDLCIERVKRDGVAVLSFRRSGHIGRLGRYGARVARAGLGGLFFANVQDHKPLVAVHGGSKIACCTNPVCVALPADGGARDFVLDFATSRVAFGKIRDMIAKGVTEAPEGLFLDGHGVPSRDPLDMMRSHDGALLPFGEHKGSGLLVACELLAGALTGSATQHPRNPLRCTPEDQSPLNSVFAVVFDPALCAGGNGSGASARFGEIDAFLDHLRAGERLAADTPILMAGDKERHTAAQRASGIPIPRAVWGTLVATAKEFGAEPAPLLQPHSKL